MVRTGGNIHWLIERWLSLWKDGNYDTLMQEAGRCDRALRSSHGHALKDADIVRVFTRLMLQDKVCAAVRWATECAT